MTKAQFFIKKALAQRANLQGHHEDLNAKRKLFDPPVSTGSATKDYIQKMSKDFPNHSEREIRHYLYNKKKFTNTPK